MKKLATLSFLFSIISIISLYSQSQDHSTRIILKLKDDKASAFSLTTPDSPVTAICKQYNVREVHKKAAGKRSGRFYYIIEFPETADISAALEAYNKLDEISYAEPDFIGHGGGVRSVTPSDQYYKRQWGLKNDGSFPLTTAKVGADVDMENAWEIAQGDTSLIVAVLDSGVKLNHPEFAGRLWINHAEVDGNNEDDDDNGYIDDIHGWNFVRSSNNPADDLGHGTNVTGIIGANTDNNLGYAGVDWNCKLMILKGLDNNNSGYYSWWTEAIYYAVDNGADIINLSLGGESFSATLQDAINYALAHNVLPVACMMNFNSEKNYYPAAFPGVLAVGSTDPDDNRTAPFFWDSASGSNYGSHISVVAPGNYIYGLDYISNNEYGYYWGGTSQATPLVTGVAALLLSQMPERTPAEIIAIIEATADDMVGNPIEDTEGWDKYYGHGRVNAYKALSYLTSSTEDLNTLEEEIHLSPNPTTGEFTITVPPGLHRMRVFNIMGQELLSSLQLIEGNNHFTIEQAGVYFLRFYTDKQVITKKLIVD